VVIGVNRLLGAHDTTEQLDGAVGDDLVDVHVGLGAGAGLPDDQGEVVHQLARGDLNSQEMRRENFTNKKTKKDDQVDKYRDRWMEAEISRKIEREGKKKRERKKKERNESEKER